MKSIPDPGGRTLGAPWLSGLPYPPDTRPPARKQSAPNLSYSHLRHGLIPIKKAELGVALLIQNIQSAVPTLAYSLWERG